MYASNENFPKPPVVTGIPVNQNCNETPHHSLQDHSGPWSSGLCDCCSDCGSCCLTCWCPCITFGRIAEIVDRGTTSCAASGAIYALVAWFTGCSWIYSSLYRSKMRHQYRLDEKPCNDCLVHFFCESRALCQEYRELQNRGFDMSIGWEGNMERQNRGVAMAPRAPTFEGGMSR